MPTLFEQPQTDRLTKQQAKVLEYMRERGSITQLEATVDLGITRLAARVYDLREAGYGIKGEWAMVPTRDGATKVMRYRLERQ